MFCHPTPQLKQQVFWEVNAVFGPMCPAHEFDESVFVQKRGRFRDATSNKSDVSCLANLVTTADELWTLDFGERSSTELID